LILRGHLLAVALLAPAAAYAQSSIVAESNLSNARRPSSTSAWNKRTLDGQPDIQGMWSGATITPFERPLALGDKAYLTEQEAAEAEQRAAASRAHRTFRPGEVGDDNDLWFGSGTKVVKSRQTSLVMEPPNGRVPLTAAAEAARDYSHAHETEDYHYIGVWERCITRGVPAGMFPAVSNNAYQIIQTPGQVVLISEMIHNVRVIPIDGSPHPPANVRMWDGDSRGHWEGNTLVVDTTNFNNKGWIATSAATGRVKGVPQTEATHVVERFTRTDADTLSYEVTVTDPAMYSAPWKVVIPLVRDENYRMFEYACHEGNNAVELILGGARVQERSAVK
jgi:hypothetical protein